MIVAKYKYMLKKHLSLSVLLLLAPLALLAKLPQTGIASYYGAKFHGRKTASGERFSKDSFTAAHRSLPFGTRLRVTNPENNLSVIVRINDRGPVKRTRMIDLSYAAAKALGMIKKGLARVRIEEVTTESESNVQPLITEKKINPADKTEVVSTEKQVENGYTVQAGAFKLKENADKMKLQLEEKGYEQVTILESSDNGQPVFKVVLGPFATLPETLKVQKDLKADQNTDAFVMRRQNNN
jgi:rare lipoprotein A